MCGLVPRIHAEDRRGWPGKNMTERWFAAGSFQINDEIENQIVGDDMKSRGS
jgi:hypothetical protein